MSLELTPLSLGELQTNCYLISDPDSAHCVIIDPADDGDYISQVILENNWQPQAIILTHAHFDHVLGLLELQLNFPVPVYLHPADNFLLQQASQSARHWLKRQVDPVPTATLELTPDTKLEIGTLGATPWQIIPTPGHTPGSICLYLPKQHWLFSGDTLFQGSIGRTDFSYSEPEKLLQSLQTLRDLPPATTVFPGHGDSTTIGTEFFQ